MTDRSAVSPCSSNSVSFSSTCLRYNETFSYFFCFLSVPSLNIWMFQWICHHYEDGWDPLRSPWESQYSSPLSCTFPPYHLRTFFFALFHMRLSLAHFSPRYHTKQPFLIVHDHIFQMIIARVPPNVKGRAKESRRLCVIRWCSCRPVYWSSTSPPTTHSQL